MNSGMTGDGIEPEIFDRLQRALAADPKGLTDLYRDYLADARRKLAELKQALVSADGERLRSQAHYLKGSSQITGMRGIAQRCAALEETACSGNQSETERLVHEVAAAIDAGERELIQKLGEAVTPAGEGAAW